jgi:hypothetical protein
VLKKIVFSVGVLFSISLQSCSDPVHPDSERLCRCYTQQFRADSASVDVIGDSCRAIYIDIIKSLENDAEEMAKFDEAYAACQ